MNDKKKPINSNKKRGRPAENSSNLNQEAIIEQAKTLMLNDNKMPSIRKLASALNVDAMAIYHYFKNKDNLQEAITTSLIEDIYEPKVSDDWQQELALLCHSYLTLLSRYSGLLETLLTMQSQGPANVFIERFEDVVAPLNLNADNAESALHLLVDYLHGFALAMRCNTVPDSAANSLNLDAMKNPLRLYCKAIERL